MRQYIRHPAAIPIEVRLRVPPAVKSNETRNISLGGLAMVSAEPMEPGSLVSLRIARVEPEFRSDARVVWCEARGAGYELGVGFLDAEDAFRARMVEQVCHIEAYREEERRRTGRLLSFEEAAERWIGLHAAGFPRDEDDD